MNKLYINKQKCKYVFTELGYKIAKEEILIKGNSYRKIAKEIFDINPDTLSSMCKEAGIAKDNRRKYDLNEKYFNKIDTPEKAYWLGFIAADGYIREDRATLQIQLQESDKSHLSKFLKAINTEKEIMKIEQNGYIGYRILIHSRKMINDLVANGCFQNKSLKLSPPNIDKKLIKYWILGYYDGDGGICIYENNKRYKTYYTGTYEVLSFIKKYYSIGSKLRKEHRCLNNTFALHITETKSKIMLDDFYDTKEAIDFCLERKYNKYAHYIK